MPALPPGASAMAPASERTMRPSSVKHGIVDCEQKSTCASSSPKYACSAKKPRICASLPGLVMYTRGIFGPAPPGAAAASSCARRSFSHCSWKRGFFTARSGHASMPFG